MPETIEREPKLLFPSLERFYDVAIPLAWPIIRIAVGWNLVVHGWGKVMRGPEAYVRPFVEQGFDPGATSDPIYFDDAAAQAFIRVDAALNERLRAGQVRL